MAQIMRFWSAPTVGLGSFHYQSGTYPVTSANFNTTYNWANMPNSTSTVNADISKIIYHSAVAVMSQWGATSTYVAYSSDEDPMTRAFCNYWKMASSSINYLQKVNYTDAQWNTYLQNELTSGRPIYYRGDGSISHAWVCDGVDNTNLYHFNFGWSGNYNGYYSLGNINPGGNTLTNNQCAITGIKPVTDGSTLTTNTTWSGNMTFTTNIWVPDSLTLTISAGAVIKFAPGCGLYVFGKLICNGTAANYVVLDASDTTNGWNGVRWDNNYQARLVMADNGTSNLSYAQVEHSHSSGVSCMAYGKVVLNHCKINNCYATYGAGICVTWIPITVSYCEIFSDHATIQGGGISVASTDTLSSTISNNNFHNNVADASGGAFYFSSTNKTLAEGNTFSGNQAPKGAAGVLSNTTTTLKNSKFCNNTSTSQKGALYIQNCSPTLVDLLIANNEGCGFYFDQSSSPVCLNLNIVNNHTPYYGGGGVIVNNSNPSFKNTILNGNIADISGNQIYLSTTNCDPFFDHCNVQGGVAGFGGPGSGSNYNTSHYTNNIDLANQFIAPSSCAGTPCDGLNANWQLLSTSPDINAGDTLGVSNLLPATDLAGNPRITNNLIDIGAYEYLCVTVPVSVSITAGQNPVCQNTTVTFTAVAVNGGTAPVYQWKKNGTNAGTNLPTYSYIPVNGDVITCVLTSSLTCTTGNPATSNAITMTVTASLPVSVSITASQNPVCPGTTVTFTATPVNGGTAPVYQWKKNGTNTGTNLPTYSFTPVNGDVITCVLTSSITCTTGNPATSNAITMVVNPLPGATGPITGPASPCEGSSVVYSTAAVSNASGYLWTVPVGWLITAGQNTTSITVTAGSTGGNISVTANNSCGNSNTSTLTVTINTPPIANAGVDQTINYGASTILNGSATGGSGGNYTYHWEPATLLLNANVQNPTTANLTATVQFVLTVTDGNGCTGNDQMLVTVTGGPLSVNPTATPGTVCAGNVVQLMANAGGGTGNYTYTWTSNPSGFTSTVANPTVYPTITTTYMVIVNDGNATVSGNTLVTVNPLPGTPSQPNGDDSVDVKTVVSSVYTTFVSPADSVVWELIPTSAGVITWTGITTATVIWNPNFMGTATIKVKALNSCGESQWSQEKTTFVDNTTGIMTYASIDAVIYPNPNDGLFFIRSSGPLSKVMIFDLTGNPIAEIVKPEKDHPFDYRQLPSGVYFVHIDGARINVVRVIVLYHP